jgi:hypothetical protein
MEIYAPTTGNYHEAPDEQHDDRPAALAAGTNVSNM